MKKISISILLVLTLKLFLGVTFSSYWGTYNVQDYGALGNGAHDDTTAINNCIYAAEAAGVQGCYMPQTGHCYVTSGPIYLADPSFVLNISNPTNIQFSLSLIGQMGQGNNNQFGVQICPNTNNFVALYIGPGQGMTVANLTINGPSGAYRGQQSSSGIGICVAGASGGANRVLIENVGVFNFYTLFETGCNSDSLGAETTFRKVFGSNCKQGIVIAKTQNDINDVDGPSLTCTQNFVANAGPGISVHDGNVSTSSGQANAFSISSTSSLTAHASANNFYYTFTTTIASPDSNITGCATNVGNCIYDSWVIVVPHFGPMPLTMTAYNSSTRVATFQTWANWGDYYFFFDNALSTTDLQTDVQAASTIYAAERVTTFTGNAFDIHAVHVENVSACTTFIHDTSGFNGDRGINGESIRFNYAIGGDLWKAGTPAQQAWFYCQQSFPFIWMDASAANIKINNSNFAQAAGNDPVVIDLQYASSRCQFLAMNGQGMFNPIIRTTGILGGWQAGDETPISAGGSNAYTVGLGGCEWEPTPFAPSASALGQTAPSLLGSMMVPYVGYHPAPWSHPRIYGATYTTLGSITSLNALGSYPLPDGYTVYSVLDPLGNGAAKFVQSAQQFYSYGQTLNNTSMGGTISLLYKGQSYAVAADATTCTWLFPGLGILLNNGSGNVKYEVTGVFPDVSIDGGTHPCNFTVINAAQDGDPVGLTGTKTSTYTPSSIGQDAYTWKTLTLQFLLNRDLDPASNDNSPVGLNKAA